MPGDCQPDNLNCTHEEHMAMLPDWHSKFRKSNLKSMTVAPQVGPIRNSNPLSNNVEKTEATNTISTESLLKSSNMHSTMFFWTTNVYFPR